MGKGIILGGLLPALLFGVAGLLQKAATRTGVGLGPYMVMIGVGVLAVGGVVTASGSDRALTLRGALFSAGVGLSWALGMTGVAVALARFGTPLSRLAPLYNMNTLVVTLLALVIFAEHRELAVGRLLLGALMIVAGGTLVARA